MVVGQGEVHHRPRLDLAADHHGPLLDLVHAEDGRLRRVQDRRRHQRAVDATVGDGEGAAREVGDRQLAVACLAAEIADALLDAREVQRVGVTQHRHDEALRRADGDTDVVVVLVDDLLAFDLGIDRRQLLEPRDAGLHEEGHEAQPGAVLLLEIVLEPLAQPHHRGHVHLVEGGEHGGGVLRLLEAVGDGAAEPRHLHPLLAVGLLARASRRGGLGRGRRRGSARDRRKCGENIFLGGAAVLARGLDGGGRNALLLGELARRRTGGGEVGAGRRSSSSGCRLRRCRGGCSSGLRRGCAGGPCAGLDVAEDAAHLDGSAFFHGEVGNGAGNARIHLDGNLVGLELAKRLVDGNLVARLHQPLGNGRLGDRFAQSRNLDLDGHD